MRARQNPFRTPRIVRDGDRSAYPYLFLPLLLLWLASSWYAYDYGRQRAGFDSDQAANRLTQLRAEMKILQREREQLKRQLTNLESENRIYSVVQAELQTGLEQEQKARLALEKKLLFLRGASEGELAKAILEVRDIKTWRESPDGDYRLGFTLTQALSKQPLIQGQMRLGLIGIDAEGNEQAYPFGRLVRSDWTGRVNFKHFQKVEAAYRVPEGFRPAEWQIEIVPEGDQVAPYRDRFDWQPQ